MPLLSPVERGREILRDCKVIAASDASSASGLAPNRLGIERQKKKKQEPPQMFTLVDSQVACLMTAAPGIYCRP